MSEKKVSENLLRSVTSRVSIGTGFVAADLLLIGKNRVNANQTYAGGSCGNVLSILAYLDWMSYPVIRLGRDRRAAAVVDDLKLFNVQTTFISKDSSGGTPTIAVRILKNDDGTTKSRFEWKDPRSGEWYPRYRPFPKREAEQIRSQLPVANVFYFDRAVPSSLLLAQELKSKGALIFFEPSSAKLNDKVFLACVGVSDVLKYSHQRIAADIPAGPEGPRLEIQTLGSEGLRFRTKIDGDLSPWYKLAPFPQKNGDTTGCGDWCSAGIIERLCNGDRSRFESMGIDEYTKAMNFGQALAAAKVNYPGARGPMYNLSAEEMKDLAESLFNERELRGSTEDRHQHDCLGNLH